MRRAAGLLSVVLLAGCAGIGATPAPTFGDVQRVWCDAHPMAVVNAGEALSIAPSRFVTHKAEVEQATLDGDQDLATSLILAWVGQEITATDSDPNPNMKAMQSWETDSASDFERACTAGFEAK